MRYEDPGRHYQDLLRMRADLAALNFMFKLAKFIRWQKANNFDPNQPRVPRGYSRGGQWTSGGNHGEASRDRGDRNSDQKPDSLDAGSDTDKPVLREPDSWHPSASDRPRRVPTFDVPLGPVSRPQLPNNTTSSSLPVDDPPPIPSQRPSSLGTRLRTARSIAQWLLKAASLASSSPQMIAAKIAIIAAEWLVTEYWPYVEAYWEGPRTLLELQEAVAKSRRGTEIHHIVEQTQARTEGFPQSAINSPDNLVQVPTFTHWLITAWYQTPLEDFNWLTPREYLRNKDWETKYRMGIYALEIHGVLRHGNH